jgi:hypothetical protein
VGLQQGFEAGEMGFNDQFAAKILNGPCPSDLLDFRAVDDEKWQIVHGWLRDRLED